MSPLPPEGREGRAGASRSSFVPRLRCALQRRWFLVLLIGLMTSGLMLGTRLSAAQVEHLSRVVGPRVATILTATVLFLMSVTLDNRQIRAALSRPGPVLLACFVNMGLLPLAAWPLSRFQSAPDFAVGLMLSASVPCTMAAASVWTRKARGNDAVSLLVTLLTNALCFLITPLWLGFAFSAREAGAPVSLDTTYLMQRLIVSALLPIAAGQLCRLLPALARLADRHKVPLGVAAQFIILLIIFSESLKAGPRISGGMSAATDAAAIAWVWACCIGLHLGAMGIALAAGRGLGFARADLVAIAFAGSQKTLPIGVYIASSLSADLPLVVLPILMYHASQLFIDTEIADRMARRT